MPELKRNPVQFVEVDIAVASIPFSDRLKEKQRQEKIKRTKLEKVDNPSSDMPEHNTWKSEKRKREKPHETIMSDRKRKKEAESDEDEILADARMLRKLKSGKISEAEFSKAIGDNSEEDVPAQPKKEPLRKKRRLS